NFNKPFESATHFPDWNWNLRVESVVDPEGGIMRFSTDETLGMTTYIDKAGNTTVYEYSRMLLDKATYAEGKSKQFFYDTNRNRIKVIDENNNEWNYVYDGLNRLQKEIDPLGNSTEWIISTEGENYTKWSTKIDKNGNTWTREINGGSVMSETDPLGNKVSYTYEQFGNMISQTDAKGNSSVFSYDASGNMTSKKDEMGNAWQYTYDSIGNMLNETDPLGNTVTYQYNKLDLLLLKTSSSGDIEEFTYDANGNMISYKDANDNITTYVYDAMNNRTVVRLPEGIDITYEYNAMGRLIAEHKPNGTWKYEYDERNRKIKTIDPLSNETIYAYNGTSGCGDCGSSENISSITDALGNITRYDYDPLGRKILETDANAKSIEYEYDAIGNMLKEIDKLNHESNYNYDNANRLVSVSNHLAEKIEISYDANANKTQVKDPKANSTFYQYDKNNRPINITDAIGGQTIFAYNAIGNRVSITDANSNVTQYEYDSESRLTKTADSLGVFELNEYDNNGNLIKKNNSRAQEITFAYDGLNRLIQKTLPDNQIVSYEFDVKGNLFRITDNIGLRTYSYDGLGRVISAAYPNNMKIMYEYDAVGNRQKMTYPSGTIVNYGYDNLNQVFNISFETAEALKTFTFTYDDKGRRIGLRYPNDIETAYVYDEVDRLLSIAAGEPGLPGSISTIGYLYDQNSNRTQRIDSQGTHSYSYDNINQLINAAYPEGTTQAYTFDALGNRTNFRQDTSLNTEFITSQFSTLNQLTRSESSLFGGGNIISLSGLWDDQNIDSILVNNQIATISGDTFTIDDLSLNFGANEITLEAIDYAGNSTQTSLDITLDSTASAVYNYDPDGNLITNSLQGTTWNYSWDEENRLIQAASSLGKNIEYSYYEDGMLGSKKILSSANTSADMRYYIYDGIHCIAEYDGENGFIKEFIYGPQIDEVLCSVDESSSAHYYHQDA
ncbi:MAG: RHS repeat protein, partial [Candidatus Omnitrophica bacterium]|nr:RHS repeat protein [Candidatus Omnitrophota bacterium]